MSAMLVSQATATTIDMMAHTYTHTHTEARDLNHIGTQSVMLLLVCHMSTSMSCTVACTQEQARTYVIYIS